MGKVAWPCGLVSKHLLVAPGGYETVESSSCSPGLVDGGAFVD